MERKITLEQFNDMLNSFSENNKPLINMAVYAVSNDRLNDEVYSEISHYLKASLCRKVCRYIAQTALKGTFEIDGLQVSTSFAEMKNGNPVLFSCPEDFTFDHNGTQIRVIVTSNKVAYICNDDILHMTDKPSNWHYTQEAMFDLVQNFENWAGNEL